MQGDRNRLACLPHHGRWFQSGTLADIVNAADTGNLKAHPYAAGLEAVARGFSLMFPNDDENLEHQFFVYDALYAALKCEK